MDINQQAQQFLHAYTHGQEVPGGWGYSKALRNLNLDYSIDSVARIDALLYRLSSTISLEQAISETDKNNFFLLLGFYLGDLIAKRCSLPINWHRQSIGQTLAERFSSQATCRIGETVFMPMQVIHDLLFIEDEEQPSCLQLVDFYCKQNRKEAILDEHQHYHAYMDYFFEDQEFPGGLMFRDLLKQTFPDCSLDSLTRIDELLSDIRKQNCLDYEEFVNHPSGQNFLLFLAYYLSTTIARAGDFSLRWLSYDEVKQSLTDLPLEFETSRACLIAEQYHFPLAILSEILFGDKSGPSCSAYAQNILLQVRRGTRPIEILPPDTHTPIRLIMDSNPLWAETMKHAGTLAAHGMYLLSSNNNAAPTLLVPTRKGKFLRPLMAGSMDNAINQGINELEQNPNKLAHQAFIYSGYANLDNSPSEALILSVRCYQGKPLQLTLALPFRHASQPQGFAIYTPKLLECSISSEFYTELFQLFYQGVDEFKVENFAWRNYVEK